MKLLERALQIVYEWLSKRNLFVSPGVKLALERLHPESDLAELCRDYYVGKIKKSLLIALGGSLLAAALAVKAAGQRQLEGDKILTRSGILEGEQKVSVKAVLGDEEEIFQIQVLPLQLDEEEAENLCEEFYRALPQLTAGENPSLQAVSKNLDLQESYDGYPFAIEWKSENVDRVTSAGVVKQGEQAEEILLTANISYGDWEWERLLTVVILPEELSAEQKRYKALEKEVLAAEEKSRMEESWLLPESLEGTPIKWNRVVEDNSLLLWAGALVVSIVIFAMGDKDLEGELAKQKENMKRDYPDIVHKLALYIGAGMTLQGAFQKIASEYEQQVKEKEQSGGKKKKKGSEISNGIRKPAYEEMLYTCRELKSGVSEGNAYIHFGKRTGLQEYIRLSTLLTQNLKKGSNSLLSRLQEEADRALIERIQMGRRLGEEASTKLLVPMVLMLLVVMVIVMLPAFSSMGL